MDSSLKNNKFFKDLYNLFDKKLLRIIDSFNRNVNARVAKVALRLSKCENTLKNYTSALDSERERDKVLVSKELRTKILMTRWTDFFLSRNSNTILNPITFAFSRLALSISICYTEVDSSYIFKSNVHKILVSFLALDMDVIVGPALLALSHLALYHADVRPAIVAVDGLKYLAIILKGSKAIPNLIQACKVCGSLALHFPNKADIVKSGCLEALINLVKERGISYQDEGIHFAALCAIVNILNGCEANRNLLIELKGLKPILDTLQTASNDDIIIEAAKVIQNLAFCNSFAGGTILDHAGDLVIGDAINLSDIIRRPDVAYYLLIGLSNICTNELNQSRIGALPVISTCIIRICNHAR
jgi:hypothetical protein